MRFIIESQIMLLIQGICRILLQKKHSQCYFATTQIARMFTETPPANIARVIADAKQPYVDCDFDRNYEKRLKNRVTKRSLVTKNNDRFHIRSDNIHMVVTRVLVTRETQLSANQRAYLTSTSRHHSTSLSALLLGHTKMRNNCNVYPEASFCRITRFFAVINFAIGNWISITDSIASIHLASSN